MTAAEVQAGIAQMGDSYHNLFVPEFTFRDLRVDALLIDLRHRRCRGFEIKTSRGEFLSDKKWTEYSSFCSSLSIACPPGLIDPAEIQKPFGLLYVSPLESKYGKGYELRWAKRPQDFQPRAGLAWLWTYVKVIEAELPRLSKEAMWLKIELERYSPKGKP